MNFLRPKLSIEGFTNFRHLGNLSYRLFLSRKVQFHVVLLPTLDRTGHTLGPLSPLLNLAFLGRRKDETLGQGNPLKQA